MFKKAMDWNADRRLDLTRNNNLAGRRLERPQHDADAGLDVGVLALELADGGLGAQQRDSSTGNDAFLDRGLGRVHGVVGRPIDLVRVGESFAC